MKENQTIYIVEDNDSTRKNLCELLNILGFKTYALKDSESFEEVYNGEKGVLILDLRLPGKSGIMFFRDMQRKYHSKFPLKTIFISGHGDVETAVDCIQQGAVHFLTKPFKSQFLLDLVFDSLNDTGEENKAPESFVEKILAIYPELSKREREVLKELKLGLSSKEIAKTLSISINTVEVHRAKIIKKTNSKSIAQLLAKIA